MEQRHVTGTRWRLQQNRDVECCALDWMQLVVLDNWKSSGCFVQVKYKISQLAAPIFRSYNEMFVSDAGFTQRLSIALSNRGIIRSDMNHRYKLQI